jgi:hypothetical protein
MLVSAFRPNRVFKSNFPALTFIIVSIPITTYIHLYIHLSRIFLRVTMSSEGISLQVTIWIGPENVPKFFEALLPVYEKVIAEPECTFFEYYEDPAEPGKISWVENW